MRLKVCLAPTHHLVSSPHDHERQDRTPRTHTNYEMELISMRQNYSECYWNRIDRFLRPDLIENRFHIESFELKQSDNITIFILKYTPYHFQDYAVLH